MQFRVLFILFQYLTVVKITSLCFICIGSFFSTEIPKVNLILKIFPTVHLFFSLQYKWFSGLNKAQQTEFQHEYSSQWSPPHMTRRWKGIKPFIIVNHMASLERRGNHCMRYKRVKEVLHFAFCSTTNTLCVVHSRTSALSPPSATDQFPLKSCCSGKTKTHCSQNKKIKGNVFQE